MAAIRHCSLTTKELTRNGCNHSTLARDCATATFFAAQVAPPTWDSVRAIPLTSEVRVAADHGGAVRGRLQNSSDTTLTLSPSHSFERPQIVSLSVKKKAASLSSSIYRSSHRTLRLLLRRATIPTIRRL